MLHRTTAQDCAADARGRSLDRLGTGTSTGSGQESSWRARRSRLARPGGAVARLLAAGLFLLAVAAPGPALAQTSEKLVGNTGQTSTTSGPETNTDLAQAFTTGSDASGKKGFKLTAVKAKIIGHSSAPTYTAHIFKANTQTGLPTGSSLGTFTNPSSLATSGIVTWTATGGGIDLDAGTGYLFVLDVTTVGSVAFALTNADAEDGTPASGWSVDNVYALRSGIANNIAWGRPSGSPAMQIEVHGYAKQAPRSPFAPVQTAGVLVDNYNLQEENQLISPDFTGDLAQGFTTGSAPGGYTLTGLDLPFVFTGTRPVYSVEIRTSEPSGSRAIPTDTVEGTLTLASVDGSSHSFTAVGGIDLKPSTTYFVVIDATGNADNYHWAGRREGYDQVAGAAGWRIEDYSLNHVHGSWGRTLFQNVNIVLRLTVHGYIKNAFPPDAPAAPTVSAVSGKGGQLSVSWDAPANDNGSAVIDYDLRYFKGSSDPTNEADWVDEGFGGQSGIPSIGTATSATLSGLAPSSQYRVQVRAANDIGEGAWSDSGSGTTNAAGTNNAPKLFERKTGDADNACQEKTDTSTPTATINAPTGTLVSLSPIYARQSSGDTAEWPDICTGTDRAVPNFDDRDAEPLSYTYSYTLPDRVRLVNDTPRIVTSTSQGKTADRLFVRAQTAGTPPVDIRIDVTATDPQGASVSTHFIFQSASFPNAVGAPSLKAPGLVRFVRNKRGSAVLPAATGGDRPQYGYLYHVSGLPPGLSFDSDTRTISGTPTAAGTWTATYTADDFDGHYSRNNSPTTADTNDAASQTFMVRVDPPSGGTPTIQGLWGVSLPAHDSDTPRDGVYDTYIRGDKIAFHVQYDRPVKPTLPKKNSRISLRMHLGPDSAGTTKRANLESILYGGRVLRFVYEVQAGDTDTNGVWIQTASSTNKQVIFLANDASLVDAVTGVDAGRTLSGLPTAGGQLPGAERSKVNGSLTTANGVRVTGAEVDGATLKVRFSANLNTAGVDTGLLATELGVQGAGDV